MKHLKTYENNEKGKIYWKVSIKEPYLSTSLWKLYKMIDDNFNPFSIVEDMVSNNPFIKSIIYSGKKTIIITYDPEYNHWGWGENEQWYIEMGFQYMGELKITKKDIENYKIYKETEKYNI